MNEWNKWLNQRLILDDLHQSNSQGRNYWIYKTTLLTYYLLHNSTSKGTLGWDTLRLKLYNKFYAFLVRILIWIRFNVVTYVIDPSNAEFLSILVVIKLRGLLTLSIAMFGGNMITLLHTIFHITFLSLWMISLEKHKTETANSLINFCNMIKRQFNATGKQVRSDQWHRVR